MFPAIKPSKKAIYLDNAATTPVDREVIKAMTPFWNKDFGNPSSLYKQGRLANNAIKKARKDISQILNCKPEEIIFTAGATEALNLAIFGVFLEAKKKVKKPHFITTKIEHHAILNSVLALKKMGCEVTFLEPDKNGFIQIEDIEKSIKENTVMLAVMYANNEIGTIEPIPKIGNLLSNLNKTRGTMGLHPIAFLSDAAQAAGYLNLNVDRLGVDLLAINGSKIYGPKQTGLLYAKSGTKLQPIIHGGGQEKNLRSGTENVPGIVGLAKALELVQKNRDKEVRRLTSLRDYFWRELSKKISETILNGPSLATASTVAAGFKPAPTHAPHRLPNNLNLTINKAEGESLLLYLDSYNIAVSTGSACASENTDPSHVLLAIGKSAAEANNSIRITLGKTTTKNDVDYVLKVLPKIVYELRHQEIST